MIDLKTEELILFSKPADYWPVKPVPHLSVVHRWRLKGLQAKDGSRVMLETVQVGRHRYTSREAVFRFIAAQNGDAGSQGMRPALKTRANAAGNALAALGG